MSITNGKINMEYIHVKENYAPKIGWELGCGTLYWTNVSSNNRIQRNYKELKITACMAVG